MTNSLHVLFLDGGDPRILTELMGTGRLPSLKALRDRGCAIDIPTVAQAMDDAVWPSLVSGSTPGDIAQCHFLSFDPSSMGLKTTQEVVVEPFWLHLPDRGAGTGVVDIPGIHPHPESKADHACCWNAFSPTHRPFFSSETIRRSLPNPPPIITEFAREPTLDDEKIFASKLGASALRRGRVATQLSNHRPVTVIGVHETHAGVHCLGHHWESGHWHRPTTPSPELVTGPYEALDSALSPILQDPKANVVVVACQGIRPANPCDHLLEELLIRAGLLVRWDQDEAEHQDARSSHPGLTQRLRAAIPASLRERLATKLLPAPVQHRLASRSFRDQYDWSRTSMFPVPTWDPGLIRANVAGREASGIVAPEELTALLEQVRLLLMETVDDETDLPLVKDVRTQAEYPGSRSEMLPDLIVLWAADRPVRRARHPQLGTWQADPVIHKYRYSLHRDGGIVIMGGPSVRATGHKIEGDPLDFAPTLLALCGTRPASTMRGRPWADLLTT